MKYYLYTLALTLLLASCDSTEPSSVTLTSARGDEVAVSKAESLLSSDGWAASTSSGGCVLSAGVTFVGQSITGTMNADMIDCRDATLGHTISAGGGDDIIVGSAFADTISGGANNDTISGGDGDDILFGGVYTSPAAKFLGKKGGGRGNTKAGSGADTIEGGLGDDTINGGSGDDILRGGPGNDYIYGGNHSDSLFGDTGDDVLRGSHHSDFLDGGEGEDECDGGAGKDKIINCEPPSIAISQ